MKCFTGEEIYRNCPRARGRSATGIGGVTPGTAIRSAWRTWISEGMDTESDLFRALRSEVEIADESHWTRRREAE